MSSVRPSIRVSLRGSGPIPRDIDAPFDDRTSLHTKDMVFWLRKRFLKTNPNKNYLFFPEELRKHHEVEKIFKQFDEDESGKLGLGEFYKLLCEAGIKIDIEELKKFYHSVDDNNDSNEEKSYNGALDFREFKNCTLSDQANNSFAKMMDNVREHTHKEGLHLTKTASRFNPVKDSKDVTANNDIDASNVNESIKEEGREQFLPRTFGNLLNYITYENKKKEITSYISNDSLQYAERFPKFQELLDLQIDNDIYFAKYNEKFKLYLPRQSTRNALNFPNKKKHSGIPKKLTNQISESSNTRRQTRISPANKNLIKEVEVIKNKARENAKVEFENAQARQSRNLPLGKVTSSTCSTALLKHREAQTTTGESLIYQSKLSATLNTEEESPLDNNLQRFKNPYLPCLEPKSSGTPQKITKVTNIRINTGSNPRVPVKRRIKSLISDIDSPVTPADKKFIFTNRSHRDQVSIPLLQKASTPLTTRPKAYKTFVLSERTESKEFRAETLENAKILSPREESIFDQKSGKNPLSDRTPTDLYLDVGRSATEEAWTILSAKPSKMPNEYNNHSSIFDYYVNAGPNSAKISSKKVPPLALGTTCLSLKKHQSSKAGSLSTREQTQEKSKPFSTMADFYKLPSPLEPSPRLHTLQSARKPGVLNTRNGCVSVVGKGVRSTNDDRDTKY